MLCPFSTPTFELARERVPFPAHKTAPVRLLVSFTLLILLYICQIHLTQALNIQIHIRWLELETFLGYFHRKLFLKLFTQKPNDLLSDSKV